MKVKNMDITKPRGTRDFLPEEMNKRRYVEDIFRSITKKWGYGEVNTPIFENLNLFTIKSGKDIIDELYYFKDKKNRDLALRPELTAPVMRVYLNEMQAYQKPIKLFYFENCFRYERPQKRRYREFWQFGVEIIGGNNINADAECIALSLTLLKNVGINAEVHIGNLKILKLLLKSMDFKDKNKIIHFIDKKEYDSLIEFMNQKNISSMEIKNIIELVTISEENPSSSIKKAKKIIGDIDELNELELLVEKLKLYGFSNISIDFGVARGLDYYTGIVFEIYDNNLGSEKQICGGGSYNLIKLFGGENIISTGFGIGFDRILDICNINLNNEKSMFIVSSNETYNESIKIASLLRKYINVDMELANRSFNTQISYANSKKFNYILIVGNKKIKRNNSCTDGDYYTLKDMNTGNQIDVNTNQLIDIIKKEVLSSNKRRIPKNET